MPNFFQRPENALKRANEFIDVGKPQQALDALYDLIKSKKHRTWQKVHEPIMEKYLYLCVELKKSPTAKEGLYQYKNICQQVNIKSLEDVIRKYLSMAESKTDEARKESHQAVIDVEDLDVLQTPENLLLKTVSGEDTQDRTDRAILTPWVKFLWESYRQCLDLLRNNSSVEKLYQDVAQQAFKFCLKYQRKAEFRKLGENLRTHLGHVNKHQNQQRAINLNNPESQALHLETRLAQLEGAIQMELWQEAFKALEDVNHLIHLSKKAPRPSLMANYYLKQSLVFWKSKNYLFHACAWQRLYQLQREQRKNLSTEELQKLASRVMCATLSVPIPPARTGAARFMEQDEATMDKERSLAALLSLNSPPTRQQLMKDLVKHNVHQYVYPELLQLYRWLEVEFHPLQLAERVQTCLDFVASRDDLSEYVPVLQDIAITRIVKQVAQVYQTVKFERLARMVPFVSQFKLERAIVDCARNLELQVRLDHRTRSLSFGTDLGLSQREDEQEGPTLQGMPSENIRGQLCAMARALEQCRDVIHPKEEDTRYAELRAQIVQSYRQTAKKEHQRILQRRQLIEQMKEEQENMYQQREREEYEREEAQRRRQMELENERLEREMAERERQRKMDEHRQIQKKQAKERLEQLKSTSFGHKVFKNIDESEMADLDADQIMQKQVEQLEKEKRELTDRLKAQEKKVDYFERAMRLEEIPLLEEQAEREQVTNRAFFERQEQARVDQLKKEHQLSVKHRDRMARMTTDKNEFMAELNDKRRSAFKDKLTQFRKMLEQERHKRMEERKVRRHDERRQKWIHDREEEEQRKRDEEAKQQREEEERLAKEQKEKAEAEYRARQEKLDEQARKQREREEEMERKLASKGGGAGRPAERNEDGGGRRSMGGRTEESSEGPRPWRAGPPTGGGWRARERNRHDSWRKDSEGEEVTSPDKAPAPIRESLSPAREDSRAGGSWRDQPPRRDEPRRQEGRRDDDGPWRRGGPPARDGPRAGYDRYDDHRGPPPGRSEAWRREGTTPSRMDRAPPRDEGRDDGGAWRRGGDGGESRSWRDPDRGSRDDRGPSYDRPPMRGEGPPSRSGGGGWRDRERESGGRWSDRQSTRDNRGPPRDERDGGSRWRDGPSRDGGRGPPPSRDGGGSWRKGAPEDRGDDSWRRSNGRSPQKSYDDRPRDDAQEDGWTSVRR